MKNSLLSIKISENISQTDILVTLSFEYTKVPNAPRREAFSLKTNQKPQRQYPEYTASKKEKKTPSVTGRGDLNAKLINLTCDTTN